MGSIFIRHSGRLAAAVFTTLLATLAVAATMGGPGQPDPLNPPANGPRRGDPTLHALVGATVHVAPGKVVEHATVVIRDGRIVSVATAAAPADAQVWEAEGLHIYAAFVEPYLEVDAPQPDRSKAGVHWNAKVTPQRRALEGPGVDAATSRALRGMGFATAAISPRGGIFRGQAAVVSLAEPESEATASRPPVYADSVYQSVAFETGGFGRGGETVADNTRWDGYPQSLMGAIAMIRQTLIDADWTQPGAPATGSTPPSSSSEPPDGSCLAVLSGTTNRRLLFSVDDELDALRAVKIADEFKQDVLLLGSGLEFRRLDAIAATKRPVIVPLSFPRKPNVAGIAEAESVELRELMTWEQAPTNARRLADAGVTIAITTAKLRDRAQFRENLRSAIRHGLKEDAALAALTTTPSQLLGIANQVGTVENGKRANLIVTDGPIFDRKTKICDMWVDGKRHEITPAPTKLEGTYDVTLEPPPKTPGAIKMVIDKDNNVTLKKTPAEPPAEAGEKPEAPGGRGAPAHAEDGAGAKEAQDRPLPRAAPPDRGRRGPREQTSRGRNVTATPLGVSFVFEHEPFGTPGVFAMSGVVEPKSSPRMISGDGRRADGEAFRWKAIRVGDAASVQAGGFGGRYRITAMDGKQKAENEPATEIIVVDERTVNIRGRTDNKSVPADEVKIDSGTLTYSLDMSKLDGTGIVKVSAKREGDVLKGEITSEDGSKQSFEAARIGEADDEDETKPDVPEKLPGYPFGAYSMATLPEQDKVAFINATVWTSGPAGVIKEGAVVISEGKIAYVGSSAGLPRLTSEYKTIDCQGKHITPGIIDCHSHTGISRGVNEGGQAITAEVRIGDVTNPDAINWYRALAGGTTAVNSLHGSANPIGGQNQVNKIRWGCVNPDDMHFEGAIPGIKFALGENVKWGNSSSERGSWRYPQTRMGVETLMRDRFIAAREYAEEKRRRDGETKRQSGEEHTKGAWRGDDQDPSRADRLAEGHDGGRGNLRDYRQTPEGGSVRAEAPDAPRGRVGAVEHRGGVWPSFETGSHPVLANRERIAGGTPDSARADAPAEAVGFGRSHRADSQGDGPGLAGPHSLARKEGADIANTPSLRLSVSSSLHRDLELEALAEILAGERLVHCHSYRQDEILMLGRIAEEFGFKIGTYQHILEGYKVAEILRDYSGGASGFADWWAYKVEVQDAIPQAFPIMFEQGVLVSYNSDSDELARRLNVEAGKGMKYSDGSVDTTEAIKFITINPAKQLHVGDRTGSLETGKDADLVIWSGVPISSLSRCEATYVDGRCFYSLEQDKALREQNQKQRQRLIQKALADNRARAGAGPGDVGPGGPPGARRPGGRRPPQDDGDEVSPRGALLSRMLDDANAWRRDRYLDMLRRGINPADVRGGECGCEEWMYR